MAHLYGAIHLDYFVGTSGNHCLADLSYKTSIQNLDSRLQSLSHLDRADSFLLSCLWNGEALKSILRERKVDCNSNKPSEFFEER